MIKCSSEERHQCRYDLDQLDGMGIIVDMVKCSSEERALLKI